MNIEQPHETARLKALLDELEHAQRRRMFAAWQEIRAERIAREERIMACVRPKIEETEDNG
jgi:hypothetical protein